MNWYGLLQRWASAVGGTAEGIKFRFESLPQKAHIAASAGGEGLGGLWLISAKIDRWLTATFSHRLTCLRRATLGPSAPHLQRFVSTERTDTLPPQCTALRFTWIPHLEAKLSVRRRLSNGVNKSRAAAS